MVEEKIMVTYQGKYAEAVKTDTNYNVKLPVLGNKYGSIYNTSDGWVLEEIDKVDQKYFSRIKLRNDGKIEYETDTMEKPTISDNKFNPENPNIGELSEKALNLFYVVKQIAGYEKLGVPPIAVLQLRYKILALSLNMLGYQSVGQIISGEPSPEKSIMDLNRAVQFIEQYPALAQYVTKVVIGKTPSVDVSLSKCADKSAFMEQFEEAQKAFFLEKSYHSERSEFLENIREPLIKPDFCIGMRENIDPRDWGTYSQTVKRLGKLLLSFNSDLLPPVERMRIIQGAHLSQDDVEHQVSLITQTAEMDEVLGIESYYFFREHEKFEEKMQREVNNESTSKLVKRFRVQLNSEEEERKKAIQRRDYFRKVYPYSSKEEREKNKKKKDDAPIFGED